ncbi:MAG: RNA polymerase factor sigma-54 [Haliscomenobacter sp.]|nr:RNA polymerase factor sigma-54 [Haliscomenobacter sp.]
MRTGLGQKQLQLQKLSPQQIQLMKLLQVPTYLLEQRIKEELEINPALEEGDAEPLDELEPFSSLREEDDEESAGEIELDIPREENNFEFEDYVQEYLEEDDGYKLRGEGPNPDEEERQSPVATENSFHEYLEQQLGMLTFAKETHYEIALQLVGSIDDDGYLRRSPDALCDDLLFSKSIEVTEEEILEVLKLVQRLDPPGVGARDLQECLLIQLENRLESEEDLDDEDLQALQVAQKLIAEHFDAFSKKHYEKLQRILGISEQALKRANGQILKLNPKPASGYTGDLASQSSQYVIPDFILINREGELELSLNSRNAPDLKISQQFREMYRSYSDRRKRQKLTRQDREAMQFIKQKIESARWFIDAIRQRHETMFKTMYAILEYQHEYFMTGDQKRIRPMILNDIAEMTGLDVSTVSRVANSKFVQTEYGTKRLKEFFSEGLQTAEGEEVSTLEVKKILLDMIGAEDKRHPLSDDRLTQVLQEKGYTIARRTVAKYRDQLNIPKASLRKAL